MSKLEEFRTRKLVRDISKMYSVIEDAVEENFGYCPNDPWFNKIMDEYNENLDILKKRVGQKRYVEIQENNK
jgi:hypothetical protein